MDETRLSRARSVAIVLAGLVAGVVTACGDDGSGGAGGEAAGPTTAVGASSSKSGGPASSSGNGASSGNGSSSNGGSSTSGMASTTATSTTAASTDAATTDAATTIAATTDAATTNGPTASVVTAMASAVQASSATGILMGPCGQQCSGDAGCAMEPPMPGQACGMCLTQEANMGAASSCVASAALGADCQGNADCQAMVNCVITGGTQMSCALQYPAGYAFLQGEVYESCGGCGDGS